MVRTITNNTIYDHALSIPEYTRSAESVLADDRFTSVFKDILTNRTHTVEGNRINKQQLVKSHPKKTKRSRLLFLPHHSGLARD